MEEPFFDPKHGTWKERANIALWTFLTVAAIILFYYLLKYLGNISVFIGTILSGISPVLWGLVFAYLLDPIARVYERNLKELVGAARAEKFTGRIRAVSAVLTLLTAIVFITLLIWLVVPEISNSITGLVKELPSQIERLSDQLQNKTFFDDKTTLGAYANSTILEGLRSAEEWFRSDLPSQANLLFSYLYTGAKGVFNVVYNLVIGLILSVYITIDKERLMRQISQLVYSIFPKNTTATLRRMFHRGNRKLNGAIRGKMVDSLIIGMICFILLTFMNLLPWFNYPYPVLLAVIVGVTNVVPFFGPFVGGFITGVLVLFEDPRMTIPYVILIVVLQQFDCNFLDPHIVGGSIGLRPFWSIFACLLGSSILGVPGFIIGPPVVAFIYEIVSEWTEERLRAKHLETMFDIPSEPAAEETATEKQAETRRIGDLLQARKQKGNKGK